MRWNARDKKENNDKNPAAGNRISHYEIIRKVGATGLGIIYLAEDTWKRNKVTLKLFYEKSGPPRWGLFIWPKIPGNATRSRSNCSTKIRKPMRRSNSL